MPTNHTSNYNLNQWVKSDQVKMEDFNADNAKIDLAIKAAQQKADDLAVSKADASALTAEINARTTAINAEINARTAAVSAEATARTAAISALNTAVGKRGNCQIQVINYTGNGGTQTLTFSEKPILVLLVSGGGALAVCLYGGTSFRMFNSGSNPVSTTWTGNTLSWDSYIMNYAGSPSTAIAFSAKD